MIALAQCGDDTVVADPGGYFLRERSRALKAYVYTDRPIYRPGHDVHLKAVLRWNETRHAASRSIARQVEFVVTGPGRQGRACASSVRWTRSASAFTSLTLPAKVAPRATTPSRSTPRTATRRGSFEVQEYRKPEFEVSVSAPQQLLPAGKHRQGHGARALLLRSAGGPRQGEARHLLDPLLVALEVHPPRTRRMARPATRATTVTRTIGYEADLDANGEATISTWRSPKAESAGDLGRPPRGARHRRHRARGQRAHGPRGTRGAVGRRVGHRALRARAGQHGRRARARRGLPGTSPGEGAGEHGAWSAGREVRLVGRTADGRWRRRPSRPAPTGSRAGTRRSRTSRAAMCVRAEATSGERVMRSSTQPLGARGERRCLRPGGPLGRTRRRQGHLPAWRDGEVPGARPRWTRPRCWSRRSTRSRRGTRCRRVDGRRHLRRADHRRTTSATSWVNIMYVKDDDLYTAERRVKVRRSTSRLQVSVVAAQNVSRPREPGVFTVETLDAAGTPVPRR